MNREIEEDTPLSGKVSATDVDGDPLTFNLVEVPKYGQLAWNKNDGSFTYTPNGNFYGEDRFTFQVSDGTIVTEVATVNITVRPVNDKPVATNLKLTTLQDAPVGGKVVASDVDGDSLRMILVSGPSHAQLTWKEDGTFTYTPHSGFYGEDWFTYKANDGREDSEIGTVSISVYLRSQWANEVLGYSSQWSSTTWAASQALGAPNTYAYGDIATAWAPRPINGSREYLTLGFGQAVQATGIRVRETYGNGFVYQVDLLDTANNLHTIWTGSDPAAPGQPGTFVLNFAATPYLVRGVKIYVNTDHNPNAWEEIDAVELRSDG
jgi:VCBS repeat-containing protein